MSKQNEIYWNFKRQITELANELKGLNDRPARRMALNDNLDGICREMSLLTLREKLSERRARQYEIWLTDYTIKRHSR